MPWLLEAMKDVSGCDKPWGAAERALIRGFPNRTTFKTLRGSERGELKHLSTHRRRKQIVIS